MKKYVLLIFIAVISLSCETIIDQKAITEEYNFKNDATLELHQSTYEIVSGSNIIFSMGETNNQSLAADAGYSMAFIFEIEDTGSGHFQISNSDIKDVNYFFGRSCFCYPITDTRIKSGEIEGTRKNNNTWHVSANILLELGYENYQKEEIDTVYSEHPIEFEGDFILKTH